MKHFTQWTSRQVISLIPIKTKESINEEREDQQPDATLMPHANGFIGHMSVSLLPPQ